MRVISMRERDPFEYYECTEFEIVDEVARLARCLMCRHQIGPAYYCKVVGKMGNRVIPVCSDCISLFREHLKK